MIGHYGFNFGAKPDVFEALANFNTSLVRAGQATQSFTNDYNPHARNLSPTAKKSRRAKGKRARQARKANRSK